jgi:phage terminase large subunit GpA-like protein
MMHFRNNAYIVGAEEWRAIFKAPVPIAPSVWAVANLIVPDGPRAASAWDMSLTPYIAEPLDMLGPESPVNEIAAMKSAQGGFTLLLIALMGHTIDRNPCRVMIIQPTDAALSKFNREKLAPAIKASAALRRKVASQTSRSAEGSTTYSKRFPGGSLTLAIATSAADLRSDTIKVLLRDEIDQYPDDLDGQGDPLEMSDGRQMAFLASADWKKADISTPTIKGASKIERRYLAGDQRRWHVRCPGCGGEFAFEFGTLFRFSKTYPHQAHYVAPCCGSIVEYLQRTSMVRGGRWIATDPRPGAFPSYHFDALSSPFVPWDEIAKAYVAAGDDSEAQDLPKSLARAALRNARRRPGSRSVAGAPRR